MLYHFQEHDKIVKILIVVETLCNHLASQQL